MTGFPNESKLMLRLYGEAFVVDLDHVLFFEADDHYTHVFMVEGHKFMVPFGLSKIEEAIDEMGRLPKPIARLGRRYIVNMSHVFHVNVLKQVLLLNDNKGVVHTLQVSKAVLRQMLDSMEESPSQT